MPWWFWVGACGYLVIAFFEIRKEGKKAVRVNVVVNHDWAIPRTAELTGVSEEEIRKGFEEAHQFGKPYVFNVEMSDKQFKNIEDVEKHGDANGT